MNDTVAGLSRRCGTLYSATVTVWRFPVVACQCPICGCGKRPRWSPDGNELFYVDVENANRLMVVSVERRGAEVEFGTPEYAISPDFIAPSHIFLVSADGQRFLMPKPVADAFERTDRGEDNGIIMIINWFDGLRERVPVGRERRRLRKLSLDAAPRS